MKHHNEHPCREGCCCRRTGSGCKSTHPHTAGLQVVGGQMETRHSRNGTAQARGQWTDSANASVTHRAAFVNTLEDTQLPNRAHPLLTAPGTLATIWPMWGHKGIAQWVLRRTMGAASADRSAIPAGVNDTLVTQIFPYAF